MPTLTLDTVAGSYVEMAGQTGGRVTRTGIVEGLPTAGVDPSDVLFLAGTATGMPAIGAAHPTRSNLILASIGVYGIAADIARVELNYEPFGGAPGVSYVIEISSSAATYESNMMPKTKTPIAVKFTPAVPDKDFAIPMGLVTMTMLRPLARVVVTQLRQGTLDVNTCATFAANVGNVNNALWMKYPAGAWLITNAGAAVSKYSGTYQTRIEATRQGDDLWSYYGVLQNQQTGKFAYEEQQVGLTSGTAAQLAALVAKPYAPLTMDPPSGTGSNGIVRVDPYAAINFSTLFGF
jgi:hypothetical protein